jgi:wyosine [tRNA(Phe)-imidazoG37] synthetase (radical SAM superfamily)
MNARSAGDQTPRKKNPSATAKAAVSPVLSEDAAYEYPRDFLDNQFVYLVISPRAGGLSIGVNVNPIFKCSFRCLYCEVDRTQPGRASQFNLEKMVAELRSTIELTHSGALQRMPRYANLPPDLLKLRHVAISGDGEPTMADHFVDSLETIVHFRSLGLFPFFPIVVVTNSTALDRQAIRDGLKCLTRRDEIWAKLDGGTQQYLEKLNGTPFSLDQILNNILLLGRQRPVVIQSLFPAIDGEPPPDAEIQQYANRLKELKKAGAEIPLVQIYSATRPMAKTGCSHLPLKSLSEIARTVRRVTGLRAQVF